MRTSDPAKLGSRRAGAATRKPGARWDADRSLAIPCSCAKRTRGASRLPEDGLTRLNPPPFTRFLAVAPWRVALDGYRRRWYQRRPAGNPFRRPFHRRNEERKPMYKIVRDQVFSP